NPSSARGPVMPRVFISHSSHDRPFVEKVLLPLLQRAGIGTWYSKNDILAASQWESEILKGLRLCDWFMVVLSPRSTTSAWVRDEVHWAIDNRHDRIIPLFLEDCNPADLHIRLRRLQFADFSRGSVDPGPKLLALLQSAGLKATPADSTDEAARAVAARIAV